jgi:predicted O-linked N-acetylglucosamine transferase (SPINDLY family)
MQKPFKRHPLFDKMLAGILEQDPRGVLLLHGTPGNPEAGKIMRTRLTKAGADMSRVHFLPPQPHHALMALYALSDVVLDSYYAGGCTTTREALEVGAPVVTLPAKYLGGRWSLAYYQIMGMAARGQWLVARNKQEYVDIAIKVANNEGGFRDRAVQKIVENIGKLYRQESAVEGWSALLEKMVEV